MVAGRWVHMLGFRGHFVTKSRGYPTNLDELRAARATYQADRDEPSDAADDGARRPCWAPGGTSATATSTPETCS
jgi:hypothetical protein